MSREWSEAHSPDPNYKPGPFKKEAEDMVHVNRGSVVGRQAGGQSLLLVLSR